MDNRKKIFIILCSFFILLSTSGFGMRQEYTTVPQSGVASTISKSSFPFNGESIETLQGFFTPFLKANESLRPGFQDFQNDKKYGGLVLSWQSAVSQKAYYSFYALKRINGLQLSPFYIAFHRLTV